MCACVQFCYSRNTPLKALQGKIYYKDRSITFRAKIRKYTYFRSNAINGRPSV